MVARQVVCVDHIQGEFESEAPNVWVRKPRSDTKYTRSRVGWFSQLNLVFAMREVREFLGGEEKRKRTHYKSCCAASGSDRCFGRLIVQEIKAGFVSPL